jgi:hypothetical protein
VEVNPKSSKLDEEEPCQKVRGSGKTSNLYPFPIMDVGDSFVVPRAKSNQGRGAASAYKRQHRGWRYCTRTGEKGLRIWRTA